MQFLDSRTKLDRAERHIVEFRTVAEDFMASEPCEFRNDQHEGNEVVLIYAKLVKLPSREWSSIVGDIAHNCRSALDLAVYAFGQDDDNQFPICSSPEAYENTIGRRLKDIPDTIQTIIESHQPYHDERVREHPLSILRDVNNADKHRAVIPSVSAQRLHELQITAVTGDKEEMLHFEPIGNSYITVNEKAIAQVKVPKCDVVRSIGRIHMFFVFREGVNEDIKNLPIVGSFERVIREARLILDEFEAGKILRTAASED